MNPNLQELLKCLKIDYLLVNATNEYLVEYADLSENARYTLTGFTGSTGDALVTFDNIYLFVDGRYHTQAEIEAKKEVIVVKLQIGQKQDDEIKKLISPDKILGIVSKKISQKRLESFDGYQIKLLDEDPINNYTMPHDSIPEQPFPSKQYIPAKPVFVSNLEEVSYITGLRDFSKDCTSKIWKKLFIQGSEQLLFENNSEYQDFLKNYPDEIVVDKSLINAYDYALIQKPINQPSEISILKSIKTDVEIEAYKQAFEIIDKSVFSIREFIDTHDNLSEYDISQKLREEFIKNGAKSLSFNSIVAINQNSALAHYAKNSKNTFLREGDLVLIDCGIYDKSGLATDMTRVFVKGKPSLIQKKVYTTVLKAFLNACNSELETGFEIDTMVHKMLDNRIDGFTFGHGLGHGIGINVHEAPPNLSQNEIAKCKIKDNMTFTIEPGLYNPEYFGIRLENSCYKRNGKTHSFVKMGYEGKLIDMEMLSVQEKEWLKGFTIL